MGKENITNEIQDGERRGYDEIEERDNDEEMARLERKLVMKVDFRLCTIAGILCSLNLLDSGIISVSNCYISRPSSADGWNSPPALRAFLKT